MNDPFIILIDGACPLCRREGEFLRRLDRGRGLLGLEDISCPDFEPQRFGATLPDMMGRIHGVKPDGTILTGLAVFRHAYRLVSPPLGLLWAPTGWPGLRWAFDRLYILFARNRHRLTGRRAPCDTGRCAVD